MTPRTYQMDARAAATAATRTAILEAAMLLHAEQGVAATSWQAIAGRAQVSPATVYRHFPTSSELITACTRRVFDIVAPPSPSEAAVEFAAMDNAADRFAQLARESAHCYHRGEGWLHAAHRERDFNPDLDAAVRLIQDSLHVLVNAAARRRIPRTTHALLFTLCDYPFWKSLRTAGLTPSRAEAALVDLVRAETVRLGLS